MNNFNFSKSREKCEKRVTNVLNVFHFKEAYRKILMLLIVETLNICGVTKNFKLCF